MQPGSEVHERSSGGSVGDLRSGEVSRRLKKLRMKSRGKPLEVPLSVMSDEWNMFYILMELKQLAQIRYAFSLLNIMIFT